MAFRRAFREAEAGPSTPQTEPPPVRSLGGNHFLSAARRVASSGLGAWKGVLSKFVQIPWMSGWPSGRRAGLRSEEHTSELQSLAYLVCRLLLEKKKQKTTELNSHSAMSNSTK